MSKPAVYLVLDDIPEHGLDAGDFVVLRPSDPIPVEIVKRRDRAMLRRLMSDGHLGRMERLSGGGPAPVPPMTPRLGPSLVR